ncbi:MAG: hypothetical protein K2Y22_15275 [Candidatus Obscuribacterales bacterium]|nr:hypothetical protein [Candidatus Obscuribacterales bacterium]
MLMPTFPVSRKDFTDRVLKSTLPVVVKFTSANDGACRIFTPYVKKFASQYNFQIKIYEMSIDVPENKAIFESFATTQDIPALVFFDKGTVLHCYQGFEPGQYENLRQIFASFVKTTRCEQYIPPKNLEEREKEYLELVNAAEAIYLSESAAAIREPMDAIWNQLGAAETFQSLRQAVLDATSAPEKKLISAVHTAGHEYSLNGTSIKKSGLPQKFIDALLGLGHHTVESLYGAMIAAPEALRPYLQKFGLDYDEVGPKLKAMIPQETLDEWDKLKDLPCPTGLLLEDDPSRRRKRRFGVIRRDDDKK